MISVATLLGIVARLTLLGLGAAGIGLFFPARGVNWTEQSARWHHPLSRLKDEVLQHFAASDITHYQDFNETLDAILIPRVPGTEGHDQVRQYILKQMNALDWFVEQDVFTDRTPVGRKPFANIIATVNPRACRRLVIACHYDSLHNREYTFLGATDSAVPCSMMIHTAKLLNPFLQRGKNYELSLQYIFFDGEEAFKRWSRTDSLYGSRHLAEKWNNMQPFPNGLGEASHCKSNVKDYASYLDRMEVMVLLDLIGTANPKFFSYFLDTYSLYMQLVDSEQRLNSLKMIETHPPESQTGYFDQKSTLAFVEDDHIPFMKRGVPIIHLIPSPFPHVWHRESDNRESLHHPTINNLNKILRIFIAQYLHLDIPARRLVV